MNTKSMTNKCPRPNVKKEAWKVLGNKTVLLDVTLGFRQCDSFSGFINSFFYFFYFYSIDPLNHQVLHSPGTHMSFSLDRKQEITTSATPHHTAACAGTALCCKPAQGTIQVTKQDNTKAGSFQKEALPWCDSQPRNNNVIHHQWVAAQGHPSAAGIGRNPVTNLRSKMTFVEPRHSSFEMTEQEYS